MGFTSSPPLDAEPTEERAKWPTVWGVLFFIWAGFTALGSCCAGIGVWMAPYFAQLGGMTD
ncbi:MAG: hypothetical protein JNK53_00065, partial [Phycisphaerae bacterium]|nr:hypothetical protein [Phycisphaerae bacterium]